MCTKRNDGALRLNHFRGKRVPPQILNDVSRGRERKQPQNQSVCAIRIGIFMRRRFEPLNFKSIGTLACAFSRSTTLLFGTAFAVRQMQALSVFLTLNRFVGEFESKYAQHERTADAARVNTSNSNPIRYEYNECRSPHFHLIIQFACKAIVQYMHTEQRRS